jgi:chemosensory pili system protein ChpA (sensor histidine kinase/response regulator)
VSDTAIDTASLVWLLPELTKTIASARLRLTHAASLTGADAVKQLTQVKRLIHESTGALEVVGAKAVVRYFQCMESVVALCAARESNADDLQSTVRSDVHPNGHLEHNRHAYAVIDDACHAVISYLHELQHTDVQLPPLVLFPQYQALCLALNGAPHTHNTSDNHVVDLFFPDLSQRLAREDSAQIATPIQLSKVRPLFESLLLRIMNSHIHGSADSAGSNSADLNNEDKKALSDIGTLMGVMADRSDKPHQYSFWKACEAAIQSGATLSANQTTGFKRWLARISLQIQRVVSGSGDLSERLFRQALLFIALAPNAKIGQTALQRQLVTTYHLPNALSLSFELARYGKALPVDGAGLADKISRLKHAWSEAQPSDLHADGLALKSDEWQRRLRTAQQCLLEVQLSLSEHRLDVASDLVSTLGDAVTRVLTTGQNLPIGLGLEGAHAIVWIEQSITALGTPLHIQQQQANALADRVTGSTGVGANTVSAVVIKPQVTDQQLRAQVVGEAKVTLGLVEKQLDDMFRYGQASAAGDLDLAPLAQTASALKLIELPQLSTAIDALSFRIGQPLRKDLDDASFKHIARLFSQITAALDVFAYAPSHAQQHYVFDVTRFELLNHHAQSQLSSSTSAEQSRNDFTSIESLNPQRRADIQALAQQAIDSPQDNQTHQALAQSLQAVRDDAELTGDFELNALSQLPALSTLINDDKNKNKNKDKNRLSGLSNLITASGAAAALSLPTSSAPIASENELYTIFITEAQEVLADSAQLLHALEEKPQSLELLKDIRRGFHTLKGSARMVGFKAFGDAAWHVEQTVNTALAKATPASIDLIQFMRCGRDALSAWLLQLDDALLGMGDEPVLDMDALMTQLPVSCTVPGFVSQLAPYLQAIERGFERQHAAPKIITETVTEPSRPTIRLVANNEGMRPQDFIDKARAAVAQAYAVQASQDALAPASTDSAISPVQLQAVHVAPVLTPVIQSPQDTMVSIGPLRLPKQLYDIYVQEAGGHITALQQYVVDQRRKVDEPVSYDAYKYAHSLKGSAATIGFSVLKDVVAPLEQVLQAAHESKQAFSTESLSVVTQAVDALANIFKQFAQGTYPASQPKHSEALLRLPKEHSPKRVESVESVESIESIQSVAAPVKFTENITQPNPALAQASTVPKTFAVIAPIHTVQLNAVKKEDINSGRKEDTKVGINLATDPNVDTDDINTSVDEIDDDIWFDFEEEAELLLPRVQNDLNLLANTPSVLDSLRRDLHTLKGSSRMAGAMRMGAMLHDFESNLEATAQSKLRGAEHLPQWLDTDTHTQLLNAFDAIFQTYSKLKTPVQSTASSAVMTAASQKFATEMAQTSALFDDALSVTASSIPALSAVVPSTLQTSSPKVQVPPPITAATVSPTVGIAPTPSVASTTSIAITKPAASTHDVTLPALRMRTDTLDLWVNQATEVAGSKGRLDQHVLQLRQSLHELTDNVERLRQQLREIEIQAESQMATRTELANTTQTAFDPLEFDRFTRFQELTRMLSESLGDMLTVRDTVAKTLQDAEQDLINQTKANKALTQSLIRSRLLAFDAVSDRLYRLVRQTSRELGKQVALDIHGGHFTLDRSILERMTAGLEHLVRNSVVHGIESPAQRLAAGKTAQGMISLAIKQQGNELEIVLSDDGAGLPLARIRDTAIAKGLLNQQALPTVQQLTEFIFAPGFSTAETVTELAGRGVGMDVVRSDIVALGGRITLASSADRGARFTIRIPLTLALNQVLMVIAQDIQYAIPSSLIQSVVTVKPADLAQAYDQGSIIQRDANYPFAHLSDLLKIPSHATLHNRNASVILLGNGSDTVAIHVDSIIGNQESIIKPLSPLMARIPGLSSATLLNNGQLCLILDPVQLYLAAHNASSNQAMKDGANTAHVTGSTQKSMLRTSASGLNAPISAYALAPQSAQRNTQLPMAQVITPRDTTEVKLAMIVDDSLTVRKVTQKLLLREGWEVLLAKDGIDALEQLQTVTPSIMLVDIEMPRMDGFDLTRNVRADDKLKAIPIIMITSRIADKHRDHAFTLGVDAYMGKPYRDDELLAEMLKLTAA